MLPERSSKPPYLIHTNRELGLMLAGGKPMAMFYWIEGDDPDCLQRYLRMFDRHVAEGRMTKTQTSREVHWATGCRVHRVLYTLLGEEWRASAMIELKNAPGDWSPERERREGELLGYADWQNDWWLERGSAYVR